MVRHRLFCAGCAVWFAALFGMTGLAASGDALTSLVLHLRLPAILPAAAPPLGMTARVLTAVALAGLGGTFGLILGAVLTLRAGGMPLIDRTDDRADNRSGDRAGDRAGPDRVIAPRQPRVRSHDAHPDAPPRRPLVVTEDVMPYQPPVAEPATAPSAAVADDGALSTPSGSDLADYGLADRGLAGPMSFSLPHTNTAAYAPPLASQAAAAPQVPLAHAPVSGLGLVQLIERLALAIAERQAHRGTPESQARQGETAPRTDSATADEYASHRPLHRFDPLTMDPAGPLLRKKPLLARRSGTDARPGTASNAAPTGDLATDFAAAAHLPSSDAPTHADDTWNEEDETAAAESRYSSLVTMAMPRPELVPTTAAAPDAHMPDVSVNLATSATETSPYDPVLRFPVAPARIPGGDAGPRPDAADADRALRDALATLQRMGAKR